MKKKKSIVSNYVVNDVAAFSDALEVALCRNAVSYVHVDNEFHCFDRILRFYSFKEYRELCEIIDFIGTDENTIKCLDPTMISLSGGTNSLDDFGLSETVVSGYSAEKTKTPSYTKKMRRQSSRSVNDKLRQNRK